jgi:putative endopeptidase
MALKHWLTAAVTGELQKLGVSTFTGFGAEADAKDSKMNVLYQGQSGLSLGEKSYYERPDSATQNVRNEFVAHVNKMFSLASFPETNPGKTILDLETKLAAIQLSNVDLRDPIKNYNRTAYSELKKLAPDFDWETFAQRQDIKADTIILQNKEYLTKANALVKGSSLEVLKTYTKWQLLSTFAGYLPKAFDVEDFRFFGTVLTGKKVQKTRAERAIRSTDAKLGMPLGKLFAKKYFPESSKEKVSKMIENVRTVYGERIDKLTWMGDSTKQMAHKKTGLLYL